VNRPSFQFYPGDWQRNAKLRRCNHAERGIWLDVMCLLHDSDLEYGVLRWPLKDLAEAARCTLADLRELRRKGVLKGADSDETCESYVYVPRHAGKDGEPVTLIETQPGPLWYSSRMVRDEYVRSRAGASTRFGSPSRAPSRRDGEAKDDTEPQPSRRHGPEPSPSPSRKPTRREGAGSSSAFAVASSTATATSKTGKSKARASRARAKTPLPPDFSVSESVQIWAAEKGYDRLEQHLEAFKRKASMNGYSYANWDSAFMEAIDKDWAELRSGRKAGAARGQPADQYERNLAATADWEPPNDTFKIIEEVGK
jgi:hypothetical protein